SHKNQSEESGGNGGIRRRSAKTGGTKGSDLLHHHATDVSVLFVEEMARIVARIRQRWPKVRILLRADSGFAREASISCSAWPRTAGSSERSRPNSPKPLMAWCENNGAFKICFSF